jgi:putative ABC transport system permease protein
MSQILKDLRQGWRFVARQPLAAAIAIVGLAIGIGANVAVFSAVDRLLLRPLPFSQPAELVVVRSERLGQGTVPASYPDFVDWREGTGGFEELAAFAVGESTLTGQGEPRRLTVARATANLLPVLGTPPAAGRWFGGEPAAAREVVISNGLARRHFGGAGGGVGSTLRLDGVPHTVVGVMPQSFGFPPRVDVWRRIERDHEAWNLRGSRSLGVVGRLGEGVSREAAEQELARVQQQLRERHPETNEGIRTRLVPLRRELAGSAANRMLVLFGAVLFLLVIACFNFAGILLAASEVRDGHMVMRVVMGASRGRLVRQLLAESVLLSLVGGGLGMLVAHLALEIIETLLPPHLLAGGPRLLHADVLVFSLLLSLVTGAVVGLATAARVSRRALEGSRYASPVSAARPDRQRLRRWLVAGEVALTLILLSATGLLLHSFLAMQRVDTGFEPAGRLVMGLQLPAEEYEHPLHRAAVYAELLDRVRGLPGSEGAALTSTVPLGGHSDVLRFFHSGLNDGGHDGLLAQVTEGYFEVMGIALLEGEPLSGGPQPPREAVVNQRLARSLWRDGGPIGREISFSNPYEEPYRIVGIVEDVRHSGLDQEPGFQVYLPFEESPGERAALVVRSTAGGDGPAAGAAVRQLRSTVAEVLPNLPLADVRSMDELQGDYLAKGRVILQLLAAFALASLVLAMIGVYGLVSLGISQRQREIGVYMALGASRKQILRRMARQGLAPSLGGLAVGFVAASLLSGAASKVLYGIVPLDPVALGLAVSVLAACTVLAVLLPSRRALEVDPAVAMRVT